MFSRPRRAVVWTIAIGLPLVAAVFLRWDYNRRAPVGLLYRIGWENDPPYELRSEDGSPAGLAVELIREAAKRRHIRLQWVWQPGSSENAIRKNLVDLWPLMTITGARKGLVYFSDPYLQHDHGLLVRAESPYQKPQDLAHARVARTTLPLDQQMVHRILPDAIAVSTPTQKEGIENVCQGHADAAFVEEFTGVTFLLDGATCPGQHLRLIWVEELQTKLAVGSTFASSGAADELRKGIAEFADDGGLPQLMARWGYYSPRNLENMVALLKAKRRERILMSTVGLLALLFGLFIFETDRIRRQKNRIRSLQAAAAQRECEDRFRGMADTAPVMIWLSDPARRCTFLNKEWLSFTGRAMEQELGLGWTAGVHPDDLEHCLSAGAAAFDGHREFRIDYRLRRADGTYRLVLDHGVPRFEAGDLAGFVGCCIDITDLKRAQEENLARQKLESVGRLAGGIAHDFNNLLGAVLAHAEVAAEEVASGLRPDEELHRIREVAIRGAEIVRQLMIYAGQESGTLDLVDVSMVVAEMLDLLNVSVSKHAIVRTDLEQGLGGVRANPPQLRQLVMNLVSNASEAIGERDGVIQVSTKRRTLTPNSLMNEPAVLPEGEYVQLSVSDTGAGIPPEEQARVFDPFFTTKIGGHGHGLGLAVVQGIVRSLGGAISLRSTPQQGTTFEVLLPCTSEPAPAPERADSGASALEVNQPERCILVVEDEDALRSAVCKHLRLKGFPVMEASDGTAGVELLQTHGARIALLLLDVTLPGKPSQEVFEEARRVRADMKVIVTSAYSESKLAGSFPGLRIVHFIRKPYHLAELVELVRKILSLSRETGA
jgi:PAS domain S-box-containing protein